jgi:hypothetical protein
MRARRGNASDARGSAPGTADHDGGRRQHADLMQREKKQVASTCETSNASRRDEVGDGGMRDTALYTAPRGHGAMLLSARTMHPSAMASRPTSAAIWGCAESIGAALLHGVCIWAFARAMLPARARCRVHAACVRAEEEGPHHAPCSMRLPCTLSTGPPSSSSNPHREGGRGVRLRVCDVARNPHAAAAGSTHRPPLLAASSSSAPGNRRKRNNDPDDCDDDNHFGD